MSEVTNAGGVGATVTNSDGTASVPLETKATIQADAVGSDTLDVTDKTATTVASPAPNPVLEKVLKEKRNAMERVRELEGTLQNVTDERLKEKEDWKTLYESTKTKLDEVNTNLESERVEKINGHKLSSLKRELSKMGAQENSMDALLKLADTSALKFDPEHKVVLGTEMVAKQIKDSIPAAFGRPGAGVDQSAPQTNTADLSIDSFKSMSAKDRSNPDVIKALYEKHGVKLKD